MVNSTKTKRWISRTTKQRTKTRNNRHDGSFVSLYAAVLSLNLHRLWINLLTELGFEKTRKTLPVRFVISLNIDFSHSCTHGLNTSSSSLKKSNFVPLDPTCLWATLENHWVCDSLIPQIRVLENIFCLRAKTGILEIPRAFKCPKLGVMSSE